MTKYGDHFTTALGQALGRHFTITEFQGLVVGVHTPHGAPHVPGEPAASAHAPLPSGDKRRTPSQRTVTAFVDALVGQFRRGARDPRYTPEARALYARACLDIIDDDEGLSTEAFSDVTTPWGTWRTLDDQTVDAIRRSGNITPLRLRGSNAAAEAYDPHHWRAGACTECGIEHDARRALATKCTGA